MVGVGPMLALDPWQPSGTDGTLLILISILFPAWLAMLLRHVTKEAQLLKRPVIAFKLAARLLLRHRLQELCLLLVTVVLLMLLSISLLVSTQKHGTKPA